MTEQFIFDTYLKDRHSVVFESIETRYANVGFPDVVFFKPDGNGTIELKVLEKLPASRLVKPDWREGQLPKNLKLRHVSEKVYLLLWLDGTYYLTNDFQVMYTIEELQDGCTWTGRVLDRTFIQAL